MNKKLIFSLLLGFFFTLIIIFLFYKQYLYPTILPIVNGGELRIFADWTATLSAIVCFEKGYDVYLENPCDFANRKHVYGKLLLFIPFVEKFPNFYYIYLPFILCFLFLSAVSYLLFDKKFKKYWLSFLILIFSVPVLLLLERSNTDIILFIFLILISSTRSFLFNFVIITISSLSKFYPILFSSIFIFGGNYKKVILRILVTILIFLIAMYYNWDSYNKIFSFSNEFSGSGIHLFSINGIIDFLKYFKISTNNYDLNWVKYLYLLLFIIAPIFYLNFKYYKRINLIFGKTEFYEKFNFEVKMYFLSSTVILFCFLFIANFVYREIYILGLVPMLISLNIKNNNNFLSFFYFLIFAKFLITTITTFLFQNNIIPSYGSFWIILKHTIDLYLISIILHVYFYFMKFSFKKVTNKIPYNA